MFGTVVLEHGRQRDASREMLLKRSSLVGRRKTADTMGLGAGGNMMVPGRGGTVVIFSSLPQRPQRECLAG